jgi:hypothetical protein
MHFQRSVVLSVFSALTITGKEYSTCGECWCIPANNGLGSCPSWEPQTDFEPDVIEAYQAQIPTQILTLECNPYTNTTCTTTPPQVKLRYFRILLLLFHLVTLLYSHTLTSFSSPHFVIFIYSHFFFS